jgi:hypothetical protein
VDQQGGSSGLLRERHCRQAARGRARPLMVHTAVSLGVLALLDVMASPIGSWVPRVMLLFPGIVLVRHSMLNFGSVEIVIDLTLLGVVVAFVWRSDALKRD